jgi:hypothetical protein
LFAPYVVPIVNPSPICSLIWVINSRTVSAEKKDPARLIDIFRDGCGAWLDPVPVAEVCPAVCPAVGIDDPPPLADTLPPPPKLADFNRNKLPA